MNYVKLPDWEDPKLTFQELCKIIKNDILLADKIFFPYSFKLSPHEAASFLEFEEKKFNFVQMMRSAAKTYLIARYILLKMLLNEINATITAPTFRQALLGFNYWLLFIKENSTPLNKIKLSKEIEGKIVTGGREARVRLKNGAVGKALPMGQGDKLRGERSDILWCDEFFNMDKEMFKVHLLPFLSKPEASESNITSGKEKRMESKLILSTSSEYEDCFAYHFLLRSILPKIKQELEIQKADPLFKPKYGVIDFNVDDLAALNFALDQDILDLQISDASEEEKQRILYNKWIGLSGQFFRGSLVEHLQRPFVQVETKAVPDSDYFATVDIAFSPTGDDFVINTFKCLGGRKAGFVNSFFKRGLQPDEIAYKIHEFDKNFDYEYIYMDKAGGGAAVAASLSKRKLVMPNNHVIEIPVPILPHDEWRLSGKKKLILNKPTDELVRQAFAGDRTRSGEEISTEEVLVHFIYNTMKGLLDKEDPDIYIPMEASEDADQYARSEQAILDNIRECMYQMRLLTLKTEQNPDGTREIVKSRSTKVPLYIWKRGKKDGAVTFCYSVVPFLLHYKGEYGEEQDSEPAFIFEPQEYKDYGWLYEYQEDPTQRTLYGG